METWEQIALGAIILLVVAWRLPQITRGMKARNGDREDAGPNDWMGVLVPVGLVILFVIVLISMA